MVIQSLLLTVLLAYNNFYFERLLDISFFLETVTIIGLIFTILYYFVRYNIQSNKLETILSIVSIFFFIIVVRMHLPIIKHVMEVSDIMPFYIIPVLLTQTLIATYYSVRNRCALPSIFLLVILWSFTFIIHFLSNDFLYHFIGVIIAVPIGVDHLHDLKSIITLNNNNISNFDYTSGKNWTLKHGRSLYSDKLDQIKNVYTDMRNNNYPINSETYANKYAILLRKRIEFCQTGLWLCNHSNGLGHRNLPRLIGPQTNFPALKRDLPTPRYINTRYVIDRKFR